MSIKQRLRKINEETIRTTRDCKYSVKTYLALFYFFIPESIFKGEVTIMELGKRNIISKQDFVETIGDAIESEISRAAKNRMVFKKQCGDFEKKYHVDSDKFIQEFRKGNFHNKSEYFDWFAAKTGFDMWEKKSKILDILNTSQCEQKRPVIAEQICSKRFNTYTL